jgi:hypothetical protein
MIEPPEQSSNSIVVSASGLFRFLMLIIIILMIASVLGKTYRVLDGSNYYVEYLAKKFFVDIERTAPAWFSSSLLFASAVLLGLVTLYKRRISDRYQWHWLALGLIFLCLSMDETVSIHEEIFDFLIPVLGIEFLHFWVIIATPIVVVFAAVYWRFLFALPLTVRRQFLAAAVLFVGGAIGIETVGGMVAEYQGKGSALYLVLAHLEEFLEMSGIAVFMTSLVSYLGTLGQTVQFRKLDSWI